MSESWDYEEKSEFASEDNDFLDIAKTIIAFANGRGQSDRAERRDL